VKSDETVFWAALRVWAMAAPPKMPLAPGGCHMGRVFVKRSGLMSVSWVSSRTFSMADWAGSRGGARMRVAMATAVGGRVREAAVEGRSEDEGRERGVYAG
jgi:hypothetical protein